MMTTRIPTNLPPITSETKTCKIITTDSTAAFTPPLSQNNVMPHKKIQQIFRVITHLTELQHRPAA